MWKIRESSPAHWVLRALAAAAVVLVVLYIPTKTSTSTISDFAYAFELIIAAMSLNLLFGFAGQISLGHSAFYGIGAYTTAILVEDHGWAPGWTFYVGAVVAFAVGALVSLPTLRLKGVYLALVTLALAVLFPLLVKWPKLEWLTNGPKGFTNGGYATLPDWPFLGALKGRDGRAVFGYWLAVVVLVGCYLVCRGIVRSRAGRSLIAVRDNQTAAAVMGVNVAATKGIVFGISAAMCALAGSLSAARSGVVVPEGNLTLVGSILFVIIMVFGGASTLWGPIVGGVGYVLLDSYLRDAGGKDSGLIPSLFGWFNGSPASLIIAALLIAFMFVAPFGIVGLVRRAFARVVTLIPRPAGTAGAVAGAGRPMGAVGRQRVPAEAGLAVAAVFVVGMIVAQRAQDSPPPTAGEAPSAETVATSPQVSTTLGEGSPPTDPGGSVPPDSSVAPMETAAPAPVAWAVPTDSCVDPEAANAPIEGTLKIGSVMPLSGGAPAIAFGPVADGLRAYVDYANAQGLLGDLKLEVEIADDQYSKDLTPGAVNSLLDNGAHIMSGIIGSPNNAAVRTTLNEECIPQLLSLSGAPEWGEAAEYPWTTGVLPPYTIETKTYVKTIRELMPEGATVGLFYVNNEFGQVYADAFKESATDGITIVETQTIEATDENPPTAQATALAAAKPDVIMGIPLGAGCYRFLPEIANAKAANPGWEPKIFLTNTCASALILALSGPSGDGLYTSANLADVGNPALHGEPGIKEYVDAITAAGKPDIVPSAQPGWTVGEVTVAIIRQAMAAGPLTRASIMNAARDLSYTPSLARPGVVFSLEGETDVYLAESLQIVQWDFDTQTFTDVGSLITEFES